MSPLICLGVDPGTTVANPLGWVLLSQERWEVRLLGGDCLRPGGRPALEFLTLALDGLDLPPLDGVAVEVPHLEKNAQTMARLSEVVGVVASFAARRCAPLLKYQPSQAKLALATDGGADKAAMMRAARVMFGVNLPKDMADAAGVALCGLGELRERQLIVRRSEGDGGVYATDHHADGCVPG